MPELMKRKEASVERALAGYVEAGGSDTHGMRAKLAEVHEDETFAIGDEVVCGVSGLMGLVISTNGPDALIAWSCRGKSVEHLSDLHHVPHES